MSRFTIALFDDDFSWCHHRGYLTIKQCVTGRLIRAKRKFGRQLSKKLVLIVFGLLTKFCAFLGLQMSKLFYNNFNVLFNINILCYFVFSINFQIRTSQELKKWKLPKIIPTWIFPTSTFHIRNVYHVQKGCLEIITLHQLLKTVIKTITLFLKINKWIRKRLF